MCNAPVYVCVTYKNNAKPLDDNASGNYDRYFDNKRNAWQYIQTVGKHAKAKPWMSVRVIVVDPQNYEHIYHDCWNWR